MIVPFSRIVYVPVYWCVPPVTVLPCDGRLLMSSGCDERGMCRHAEGENTTGCRSRAKRELKTLTEVGRDRASSGDFPTLKSRNKLAKVKFVSMVLRVSNRKLNGT